MTITEEHTYQKIFTYLFKQSAIIILWTFESLFHAAWQENFKAREKDHLHVR